MERYRQSLSRYDRLPEDMEYYLRYHGWHFSKKLCDWAVKKMKKENPTTKKLERIEPWNKEKVDELLKKYGVELEYNTGYDYVYVANMARADFLKSGVPDEACLAKFVKDMVDDADQRDGFILNRFYADCVMNGEPIPWEEVV